jgi:hypothetical protein
MASFKCGYGLCRRVGGFLSLNSDISFIVEDENEVVVGVALGVYNAREFRRRLNKSWLPNLRELYSNTACNNGLDVEFARVCQ